MKRKNRTIAAATVSLLAVTLGYSAAFADGGTSPKPLVSKRPAPPHVHGVVESVSGNTIHLKLPDKEATITTSSATVFDKGPAGSASLSSIQPGDRIGADGSWSNGVLEAKHVHLELPHVDGVVVSKTATGFKVKDKDGSINTVIVSNRTKYMGELSITALSGVAVGRQVHVEGNKHNLTMTAWAVGYAPAHPPVPGKKGHGPKGVVGMAVKSQGDTVEIKTPSGQLVTAHLESTTRIHEGKTAANKSDVLVGKWVHVGGPLANDGSSSITAGDVDILKGAPPTKAQ